MKQRFLAALFTGVLLASPIANAEEPKELPEASPKSDAALVQVPKQGPQENEKASGDRDSAKSMAPEPDNASEKGAQEFSTTTLAATSEGGAADMRLQCSALYLHDGRWQLVGIVSNWKREDWPLPPFYRDDLLQGTVLVRYDDNLDVVEKFRYSGGDVKLTDRQSIAGSLAVEIMLRQKCNIPIL